MAISESATVTSKGQVTIPKPIRDKLELESGEQIRFVLSADGTVTLTRSSSAMDELLDVREDLHDVEVDIEALRRDARQSWSSLEEG